MTEAPFRAMDEFDVFMPLVTICTAIALHFTVASGGCNSSLLQRYSTAMLKVSKIREWPLGVPLEGHFMAFWFPAMEFGFDLQDAVSRKISLDTLVDFAEAHGSQWIFITPHDTSGHYSVEQRRGATSWWQSRAARNPTFCLFKVRYSEGVILLCFALGVSSRCWGSLLLYSKFHFPPCASLHFKLGPKMSGFWIGLGELSEAKLLVPIRNFIVSVLHSLLGCMVRCVPPKAFHLFLHPPYYKLGEGRGQDKEDANGRSTFLIVSASL
ncbi:Structural maintenance of chromosomes protein 6A, partial [Mucuna pruriens]